MPIKPVKKPNLKRGSKRSTKTNLKKVNVPSNARGTSPHGKSKHSAAKNAKGMQSRPKTPQHQDVAKLHPKQKETEVQGRKKVNVNIPQPGAVKESLDKLLNNERATEYLKKNVSKMAVDVVGMLVTPKTDEFLAEQLGMKINAIRRILNIMQGYGITNYYISKNTKGWLSFAWYINTSKLPPFLEYVDGMERERSVINDTCNDYFICDTCYKSDRFIFTFDSAFENTFKCNNCGKGLSRMNKDEVTTLMAKREA